MLEVTLTNTSDEPQLVRDDILFHQEDMTIIIKRQNHPARQLLPYAQYCSRGRDIVLMPGPVQTLKLFAQPRSARGVGLSMNPASTPSRLLYIWMMKTLCPTP